MSFTVFTDGCSNLPGTLLEKYDIRLLPCSYVLDGVPGAAELARGMPAAQVSCRPMVGRTVDLAVAAPEESK